MKESEQHGGVTGTDFILSLAALNRFGAPGVRSPRGRRVLDYLLILG